MSTKIQLDLQGLNALFPEGSEARADLSRAVTHSLLTRLVVNDAQRLSSDQKAEAKKVAQETLIAMGIGVGSYSVNLDTRVRDAIRESVKTAIAGEIQDTVRALLEELPGRVGVVFAGMTHDATRPLARDWVKQAVREELANIKVSVG